MNCLATGWPFGWIIELRVWMIYLQLLWHRFMQVLQGRLFQPFGHHFLYTKITGRVLKMCQPWLQTQLITPKPGKSWPQHQLGKCCKKRGARSGPHPLLSSTQRIGWEHLKLRTSHLFLGLSPQFRCFQAFPPCGFCSARDTAPLLPGVLPLAEHLPPCFGYEARLRLQHTVPTKKQTP